VVRVPTGVGRRAGITIQSLLGQAAASPESISIVQSDRYEANDTVPRHLALTGGQFYHPLLALEANLFGSPPTADWYRVRSSTGELSVEVISAARYTLLLSDSLERARFLFQSRGWTVGGEYKSVCDGQYVSGFNVGFSDFNFQQTQSETTLVSLKGLPVNESIDIFVAYDRGGVHGEYSLRVTDGYRSELEADAYEGNEHCDQAKPIPLEQTLTGLTLDRRNDIDWYAFELNAERELSVAVTPHVVSFWECLVVWVLEDQRPPGASSAAANISPSPLLPVVERVLPSEIETAVEVKSWRICPPAIPAVPYTHTTTLGAGRYFVVVTELTGRPSRYDLRLSTAPPPSASRAQGNLVSELAR
jgi:hypothetical protein